MCHIFRPPCALSDGRKSCRRQRGVLIPPHTMLLASSVSSAISPPFLSNGSPLDYSTSSAPNISAGLCQVCFLPRRKEKSRQIFFFLPFLFFSHFVSHLAAALVPASPTRHICTAQLQTLINQLMRKQHVVANVRQSHTRAANPYRLFNSAVLSALMGERCERKTRKKKEWVTSSSVSSLASSLASSWCCRKCRK